MPEKYFSEIFFVQDECKFFGKKIVYRKIGFSKKMCTLIFIRDAMIFQNMHWRQITACCWCVKKIKKIR